MARRQMSETPELDLPAEISNGPIYKRMSISMYMYTVIAVCASTAGNPYQTFVSPEQQRE
jgi:hypothetical protein